MTLSPEDAALARKLQAVFAAEVSVFGYKHPTLWERIALVSRAECGYSAGYRAGIEAAAWRLEQRAMSMRVSSRGDLGSMFASQSAADLEKSAAVLRSLPIPDADSRHADDVAVDLFAVAMKEKLRIAREEKGRGGWQECPVADLSRMLVEHVQKGDMRDIASFAMMIWHVAGGAPVIPDADPREEEAKTPRLFAQTVADRYAADPEFAAELDRLTAEDAVSSSCSGSTPQIGESQ